MRSLADKASSKTVFQGLTRDSRREQQKCGHDAEEISHLTLSLYRRVTAVPERGSIKKYHSKSLAPHRYRSVSELTAHISRERERRVVTRDVISIKHYS